jgi:putative nucleotidyltransferase with HDIG domain
MTKKTEDEEPFNIKDLLDAKFPLLERFREAAPGSFRHSQNVSQLCESVAIELGLDTDLMKCAGLYHDIGKLNAPEIFSENQGDKNIHDDLDPSTSYHLITRHVGDTVTRLLEIPEFEDKMLLMQIVSQHHGNTVLRFFFAKAKSKVEDHFRYKNPAPQTIEAAVLMICDSVEATSRALDSDEDLKETKDRRNVVNTTVERLMNDYQLEDIKLGQIRIIKTVLFKELENIYHKRERYPDEDEVKETDDSIKV